MVASSLEKLKQNYKVEIQWRSFELRPAGSPPLSPAFIKQKEAFLPRLIAQARQEYGLEMNPGVFGVDSRPALILAKWAEAKGYGSEFHAIVFRAYWEKAQPIDDPSVLQAIISELGLNPIEMDNALNNPEYIALVEEDISLAREYQLTSAPSLVYNHKYLVVGAQPYETLRQVLEKVQAEG